VTDISRVTLFGKLGRLAYQSIESGTTFCKLRGNPYVEIVHWLHQILQMPDSDLHRVIAHASLDTARLSRDLTAALDRLPRGAGSLTDLSSQIDEAVQQAWLCASLIYGVSIIRTGHVLLALLREPSLRRALVGISAEFGRLSHELLAGELATVIVSSPEQHQADADRGSVAVGNGGVYRDSAVSGDPTALPVPGGSGALQRFTIDLTAQARANALDPIVGRDPEIRQVIDILMRRRQNNPILTGEAGVGKTAVVEGLAQRIADGKVPPALRDVVLRVLDVGLLQAGASMKGEFEQRLRDVIEAVQASAVPIILFIDEAHTLVGAGGAAGTGDAANLLKPALARGAMRVVAATTWAEYKKHIEKDPALTRRFQVVQIGEPTEAVALEMMRGLIGAMQTHHKVWVLDDALEAAVRLSHRYIPARQLPDKAVSLLDTACARVAISQHAVPPSVADAQQRVAALQIELGIAAREAALGVDSHARCAATIAQLDAAASARDELEVRWEREKALLAEVMRLRERLLAQSEAEVETKAAAEGEANTKPGTQSEVDVAREAKTQPQTESVSLPLSPAPALLAALIAAQTALADAQGEDPLMLSCVDRQAVASVVQDWTGIPVGRMVRNEIQNVLTLAETLNRRIIGQPHAMQAIARRVQTSRAGLDDPQKPIGVFLLAGTSGVGKTETALALAETLYGGEQNIITINMSEYQEAHTVSSLKGAPPGYVGYGEGGVLTEAVRRKPYSVVLLDEVEKAHPDVHELFFQVFDKGWMEDGEGRVIDFKNTLILLTTNVGTEMLAQQCRPGVSRPDPDTLAEALRQPLLEVFPAALLGRVMAVPYYPLDDEMLQKIIRLKLKRIEKRFMDTHSVVFDYDEAAVQLIAARCTQVESGGRMIDAVLTHTLLPEASVNVLDRMVSGEALHRVHLSADADAGVFTYAYA